MKETGVAIRYALAIYDIAVENNKVCEVYETLDSILNLYEKDKEFKNLMLHPLIKREEKKKIAIATKITPISPTYCDNANWVNWIPSCSTLGSTTPERIIMAAVAVQITSVSINTPSICIKPCTAG